jgi:hypothetical protein
VKGNNDSLEEIDVLLSQGDGETTDNTSKNIKQLSSTIELEVLMDKSVEAVGDGLSDHFSSGDEFSVESVENVFQVFSFSWFLRVHELQEFLDEDMGDVSLQGLDIDGIVDNQLKEKFVNGLRL